LKNSLSIDSDNLAYEFLVGQYINKKINRFPCFLETYGLFLRKPHVNKNLTNLQTDLTHLSTTEELYKISCEKSSQLSLLIQHISSAQTLGDKLHDPDFILNDLLYVLYQIWIRWMELLY